MSLNFFVCMQKRSVCIMMHGLSRSPMSDTFSTHAAFLFKIYIIRLRFIGGRGLGTTFMPILTGLFQKTVTSEANDSLLYTITSVLKLLK